MEREREERERERERERQRQRETETLRQRERRDRETEGLGLIPKSFVFQIQGKTKTNQQNPIFFFLFKDGHPFGNLYLCQQDGITDLFLPTFLNSETLSEAS